MFLPSNYGNSNLSFEQQQQLSKQQGKQANVGKGLDILGQGIQSFFGYKTAKAGGGMSSDYPSYDTYVPQQPPPKSNTGLIVFGVIAVSAIALGTIFIMKKKK